TSVSTGLCLGKRHARTLPPHGVTGELESSGQSANIGNRRAEWLRDHLQRRDIDQTALVTGILETHEREQPVDAMKARFFLISFRNLENLQPAIRPQRRPDLVGTLGLCQRTGIPRRTNGEI